MAILYPDEQFAMRIVSAYIRAQYTPNDRMSSRCAFMFKRQIIRKFTRYSIFLIITSSKMSISDPDRQLELRIASTYVQHLI